MAKLTSEERVEMMRDSIYNTISQGDFGGDAYGIYMAIYGEEIEEELWNS